MWPATLNNMFITLPGALQDSWREALRYKAKYERKKVRALSKDAENAPPRKRAAVNESAAPQRIERPYTVCISHFT